MYHKKINNKIERVSQMKLEAIATFPTTIISDALDRSSALTIPFGFANNRKMVGTAYTIKVTAGNNLPIYYAIEHAHKGDVLVINGDGFTDRALLGSIISTQAKARGIAGLVIDGAIRDSEDLQKMDFPVYARGISANGPLKVGDGYINYPISMGNKIVNPGDAVIADADGVVVVAKEDLVGLREKCLAVLAYEEDKLAAIASGQSNRQDIILQLEEQNYQIGE